MLKKTIKYTDYNGNEREEDFYFNLNKKELASLQMSVNGGLDTMLTRIIKEQDSAKIFEMFEKIILMSYGEKSDDGKYFRKSEEISTAFSQTEAYSELYMELGSNADAAAAFIRGIMPAEAAEQIPTDPEKLVAAIK